MSHEFPRNPFTPEAVGIERLQPGFDFATYQRGKLVMEGMIVEPPDYDGDGWFGARAKLADIPGPDVGFDVYASGVVPHGDGRWEDAFTVPNTSAEWQSF